MILAPRKPRAARRAKSVADDLAEAMHEVIADAQGRPSGVIHFTVAPDAKPGEAWAAVQEAKAKMTAGSARNAVGVSLREFTAFVGVSVATVKAWEAGTKTPTGANLHLLTDMVARPRYWKKQLRAALAQDGVS